MFSPVSIPLRTTVLTISKIVTWGSTNLSLAFTYTMAALAEMTPFEKEFFQKNLRKRFKQLLFGRKRGSYYLELSSFSKPPAFFFNDARAL